MTIARITNADKAWVRRWIRETMTKLGYPELGNQVKIEFQPMVYKVGLSEWNVHRKVATGHRIRVSGQTIILSESLWPHMNSEERYETVVHECCHLVDALERDGIEDPHGDNWQSLMQRLGRAGQPVVTIEQLEIPREVIYDLVQKCSICDVPGHNARTCPRRSTSESKALNKLFAKEEKRND